MRILLFILVLVFSGFVASNATKDEVRLPNWSASSSHRKVADHLVARQLMKEKGIDAGFFHVQEIMDAIHRGDRQLGLTLEKSELDMGLLEKGDRESFFRQILHKTKVDYNLLGEDMVKQFMSLDQHHHARTIRSIDATRITHCVSQETQNNLPNSQHLEIGDIIIASVHGTDSHTSVDNSPESLLAYMRSPYIERNRGFKILRRVLSTESADDKSTGHCKVYHTEDITPVEIMDSFSLDIDAKSPFQHYKPIKSDAEIQKEKEKEKEKERNLVNVPTSFDQKIADDQCSGNGHHTGSGWIYYLGATEGCISYDVSVPGSIAINYKMGDGILKKDLNIDKGILCQDCYAFFGANFKMFVGYKMHPPSITSGDFSFQAVVSGGAGYKLSLSMDKPTITAVTTTTLGNDVQELQPSAPGFLSVAIPGLTGVFLKYCPDKIIATLSGTGGAEGKAFVNSGFKESLTLGLKGFVKDLNKGTWGLFPNQPWESVNIPPTIEYVNFKVTSLGVRVDLQLGVLAGISAGLDNYDVNANFKLTLNPWAAYSVGLQGKFKFNVVVGNSSPHRALPSIAENEQEESTPQITSQSIPTPQTLHLRRAAPTNILTYNVGDMIPISVQYQDFNVGEKITVFYSIKGAGLQRYQDKTFPLLTKEFQVSSSGSGTFQVEYRLPSWDIFHNSEGGRWVIEIKMSHALDRLQVSQTSFTVSSKKSIMTEQPQPSSVIEAGTPVSLSWDALHFRYFQPINAFIGVGEEKVSENVTIYLASGTMKDIGWATPLTTVANTGHANVIIPRNLTIGGGAAAAAATMNDFFFYLSATSRGFTSVSGASAGTFTIKSLMKNPYPNPNLKSKPQTKPQAKPASTISSSPKAKVEIENQPSEEQRQLASGAKASTTGFTPKAGSFVEKDCSKDAQNPATLTMGVGATAVFDSVSVSLVKLLNLVIPINFNLNVDVLLPTLAICVPAPPK